MTARTVILHYHLFKNAGTSFDRVLQRNFGHGWVTAEFPARGGDNSALLAEWIAGAPEAVAFSSHSALGPVPRIDGARVVPVAFLRNPIARLVSVYRFERQQEADNWGAQLAKRGDFGAYVRARLAHSGDRQCRNFQTLRLAAFLPGPEPELHRAMLAVDMLRREGVLGVVERFPDAVERLRQQIAGEWPDFTVAAPRENVAGGEPVEIDDDLARLLVESNLDDLGLMEYVSRVQPPRA
ncbi:hypothetical protein GI374_00685 [Paracoccus sp. S-4012]|uniref:sulfotransferase family 2 domain-containing protein n=1 Tax=Paracoccus sp. S-4012 TaxID=2665648 RepID=UPI0012AEE665|nr:sulfotransferase family 2 domain-containing protein [Paracoccus sp. S-4012]MRX48975.1 hypothetical protein [Paracoccus sp. S-4012]